ncbi:MAG: tRNA-dihydrouridine synthase [Kiritimatiellae bacterium]|nr:tRNA-dihydrouridine synthase [Kiritimatiellia bacterium]
MKSLREIYPLADAPAPLLFLAPMAEYTDAAMRRVCFRFGASMAYSEMVNAYSCARGDAKTWSLLETFEDEGPVVAQLYGDDPGVMAAAAVKIEACGRFVGIDVNAGCPMPRIRACGAGAALIADPQRIHDILAAIIQSVHLPVSLKTRPGPAPEAVAIFEILDAAESAGAAALALHGRFTKQMHAGPVDFALMAEVRKRANIPVIGNGTAVNPASTWHLFRETGVEAVMVARGAIGRPWIFERIRSAPEEETNTVPVATMRDALRQHIEGERELIRRRLASAAAPTEKDPDVLLAAAFRAHLVRYLKGIPGAAGLRGRIGSMRRFEEIREAVEQALATCQ